MTRRLRQVSLVSIRLPVTLSWANIIIIDMLNFNGQVCVQSPTYAENVALFAFAAAHLAATPCCRGASRAAIDRYLLRAAGTQQQTRRTTDRRTD